MIKLENMKGAIFDVDGTLLDSMEIWNHVGDRYLKNRGIIPEPGLSDALAAMTVGEGAAYVKERYHLPESTADIARGVMDIVKDFYYNEAQLKPGAKELLELLSEKGIGMTVATSSEREHIEKAFERLGILHYFRQIFTCTEVGAGKTKPLVYEKAAQALGTNPAETLVFEDALYAAITAKDAGFVTVGVYDRFSEADRQTMQEKTDIYLSDLRDFEKLWEIISEI